MRFFLNTQEELIIKMTVREKIKTINKNIEQNKSQYKIDKQTAKVSASVVTGKDVLREKTCQKLIQ